MIINQHHHNDFDLVDLLNPLVNQGINTVQSAQTSIDLINKDVTFLNNNWPEIAVGIFIAVVIASLIANAING